MSEALDRRGLLYGTSAYVLWGLFPLLMAALVPAGAFEITAHRALWSLAVCLIMVAVVRGFARVRAAVRDRAVLARLAAAAALIAVNWTVMVYAVITERIAWSSLGYYINPLITVALGVVFLGERLTRTQVVAIAIAAVAVAVVGWDTGGVPWIPLTLAVSFGLYALVKKGVGAKVDALTGLTVETALLAPAAAATLWLVAQAGQQTLLARGGEGLGVGHDVLLLSTGVWTAGVLIIFAAGARPAAAQRDRPAAVHHPHHQLHAGSMALRGEDASRAVAGLRAGVGGAGAHHGGLLAGPSPTHRARLTSTSTHSKILWGGEGWKSGGQDSCGALRVAIYRYSPTPAAPAGGPYCPTLTAPQQVKGGVACPVYCGGMRMGAVLLGVLILAGCSAAESADVTEPHDQLAFRAEQALASAKLNPEVRGIIQEAADTGVMSFEDYKRGMHIYVECMASVGVESRMYETTSLGVPTIIFTERYIPGMGVDDETYSDVSRDCADRSYYPVIMVYQSQPSVIEAKEARFREYLPALAECLAEHGVTLAEDAVFDELWQASAQVLEESGVHCETETGFEESQTFPADIWD